MKRSEINNYLRESVDFFDKMNFLLPPWAYTSPEMFADIVKDGREILSHMLGWDITDFGSEKFQECGLVLFTLRNGAPGEKKTYAEKIMMVRELQETPMHCHMIKTEDIINRGGGNLIMELYAADKDGKISEKPFFINTDGITRKQKSGDKIILLPGESICLEPGIYHRFYGEKGHGNVLVGEVSSVNDDAFDNRFLSPVGRFPEIEEDELPLYLLVNDYKNIKSYLKNEN